MAKKTSRLGKVRETALALWDEARFHPEHERSRLYKFSHFWVLVSKSFVRNRCPIRAAALSYTSLLALIPMLAVALSVTSTFLKSKGEEQIYHFIDSFVSTIVPPAASTNAASRGNASAGPTSTNSEPLVATNGIVLTSRLEGTNSISEPATNTIVETQAVPGATNGAMLRAPVGETNSAAATDARLAAAQKKAAGTIHDFIQNTQTGTIGILGTLFLIYVAIQMLRSIESTFNDIWGVVRGRSLAWSVVIYWAVITLGPMLLAGALALTSGPHFQFSQQFLARMPHIVGFVFKLLPVFLIWLLFALFYKAVPNTKVHFKAALVGGMVGGTAWQVNNLFGFLYVSRVVKYSAFYGGVGLIPVIMVGLYTSWLILLFGAQVAYAFQNRALYFQEKIAENVNQRGREFVALRLLTCIGQRFQRGQPPVTIHEMSGELGIPSRLVQQVLQTLVAAHLVIEIAGAEPAYTPARPLESITAHHVLQAMRATPGQELLTRDEPVREEVYGEFARIQEAEKQVASAVNILALVNRAQARLELCPARSEEEQIRISPALVPSHGHHGKTKPEPVAVPTPPPAPEVAEPKPVIEDNPSAGEPPVTHTEPAVEKEPPLAPPAQPIAEPLSDDERDFPL